MEMILQSIIGEIPHAVPDIIQTALGIVQQGFSRIDLPINLNKTLIMPLWKRGIWDSMK
jgi:hypothetical protein